MSWLIGNQGMLWAVACKAVLLYGTGLLGLRLTNRRTLAQMSLFDFVTAVAIGAVIGRTATAPDTSYAEGAAALFALIAVHQLIGYARFWSIGQRLTDHRIRLLVVDGDVQVKELRACGLTMADLRAALRQQGVRDLAEVRHLIYERNGRFTVVPARQEPGELINAEVRLAAERRRAPRHPG
ncbi:DUF421 domain-containing protein [Saccharopolyspora sp. NPDC002376]